MKILVPSEDAKKCYKFAKEFAAIENEKSGLDFGSKKNRNYIDKIADITEGKLGEAAFSILMRRFGIDYLPDFSIKKGRLNTDEGQDVNVIKLNGANYNISKKVDIKTAKKHCQWLLAEKHKFWADIYILIGIDLPAQIEQDLKLLLKHLEQDINCEFRGYAFKQDFYDSHNEIWFNFSEKTPLLKPKFVKGLINKARKEDENYIKATLLEYYSKSKISNNDRFMNVKLKAPLNYGLPVFLIRKNINILKDILLDDS